ncbi:DUF4102 domain-containing protein [Aurantiacibacter xanthus]|uniref:DUF4102 domain-containing protein n=1 Tax=Aurantiacibacter xanthus TaxID=1784712 RepID=A0A3A1P5E5_9SPHN|nr:Arm DNA-binding domain-containing protein [Aurantiacibacter xanthus]RIV88638.1 DUF4102 domain-containing protein [Aurantiacibacter xanthus]
MLTDRDCRNATPGPRPVKLLDGHGLHLYITPTGFKSWRLKYRFGGKKKQSRSASGYSPSQLRSGSWP